MIIFDLDGTLADCEHRRHFIDPIKAGFKWGAVEGDYPGNWTKNGLGVKWQPNWPAFYEACDQDKPIKFTIDVFESYWEYRSEFKINIWSGRCESVRNKTLNWLCKNIGISFFRPKDWFNDNLKMRPIGDTTPLHELKERWLIECSSFPSMDVLPGNVNKIEFAFDSEPQSIAMWRRRGIFVFNCCQHDNV